MSKMKKTKTTITATLSISLMTNYIMQALNYIFKQQGEQKVHFQ